MHWEVEPVGACDYITSGFLAELADFTGCQLPWVKRYKMS